MLIVWCEIPFHHVMTLSMAFASFSLPSCYLIVAGMMHLQMETCAVCILVVHVYFIKASPHTSPSSLSQYRALFRQCCGVGSSHLLLLQRDSHGVQLPGEGMDLLMSNPDVLHCRPGCRATYQCVTRMKHHERDARKTSLLLILG